MNSPTDTLSLNLRAIEAAIHMNESGEDIKKVCNDFGVARKRVERSRKVVSNAIPEVLDALKQGKIHLTRAYDIAFIKCEKRQKWFLESGERIDADIKQSRQETARERAIKAKKLNEERVDKILELAEKVEACCNLGFVSAYSVITHIKELKDYCASLKVDGNLKKRSRKKKSQK